MTASYEAPNYVIFFTLMLLPLPSLNYSEVYSSGWELSPLWNLWVAYSQPVDFTRFNQSVCLLQRACPASGTASHTLSTCTRAMTRSSRVSCVTWGTTPSCGRKRTASDIASESWPPGRTESRLISVSMCCMTQVSRTQWRGRVRGHIERHDYIVRPHETTFWFHL